MKAFILICTLLLIATIASSQTIAVVDDSSSDSPLSVKGTIVYSTNPPNGTCAITGRNNGSQAIVAWRQDISAVTSDGQTSGVFYFHRHDHIFKSPDMVVMHSPQPGTDFDAVEYGLDCTPLGGGNNAITNPPTMHFKTLWVQFIDGSTWGDPDAQSYVMDNRRNAVAFMNALLAAYNSGGEAAFMQAYTTADFRGRTDEDTRRNGECMAVKAWLRDHPGITGQLAEINGRLAAFQYHQNWMR